MPYLIGLLGAIVTVLVLLKRLANAGIDLGGLNPFARRRRRAWQSKFEANPLFGLEDPMDAAAALSVGVAKASGDLSSEQKSALLAGFRSTFDLNRVEAEKLLASSAYLVGDGQIFSDQVEGVVAKSREHFTDNQIASTLALIEEIAAVEGATEQLRELIGRIEEALLYQNESSTWQ